MADAETRKLRVLVARRYQLIQRNSKIPSDAKLARSHSEFGPRY
jgi:hypothetical protein